MKINYTKTWILLNNAGFKPVQMLDDMGHGYGISIKNPETDKIQIIIHEKDGMFFKAVIEGFITSKGYEMPTYRAKWSIGLNDDDAFPSFNASNLAESVYLANKKWPAKPGEEEFNSDVMQIFTTEGWQWAVKWPRCYGAMDDTNAGPGCDKSFPCWNDNTKCIRRSHEAI